MDPELEFLSVQVCIDEIVVADAFNAKAWLLNLIPSATGCQVGGKLHDLWGVI